MEIRWILLVFVAFLSFSVVLCTRGDSVVKTGPRADNPDPPVVDRQREVKDLVGVGLWPVYVMYTAFVGKAVQLKYFDHLDQKIGPFKSFTQIGENIENEWQEWVKYFIGFAICIAFGIVAFLVMLITALVLPCCRACGKCGGKHDPMDNKKSHRQRLACSISLLIFNCILVLGVVCIFVINERINDQLEGEQIVFDKIKGSVEEVKPFLRTSVQEVNTSVLQNFVKTKDDIFDELQAMPVTVLNEFDKETKILETFNGLDDFSGELNSLSGSFNDIESNVGVLNVNITELNTTLDDIKSEILATLMNCSSTVCDTARQSTEQLFIDIDPNSINVTSSKIAIQLAIDKGFPEQISYVSGNVTKITDQINTTTKAAIDDALAQAEDIEKQIVNTVNDLQTQVEDLDLSMVTDAMDDAKEVVEEEHIADIVYWSVVGLASTLCLIIATNLIGLLHGAACPRPKGGEKCTNCNTKQASRWLLTSSAVTFIFYWIYLIIVLVTFAAGGLVYTEVCRNLVYFNDANSIKTLNILDRLVNESILDINIEVFDVYRQCERNRTIYTALKLAENGYNLSEIINITEVKKAIDEIKRSPIHIPQVELYPTELQSILDPLDGALNLGYDLMIDELAKEVTTKDLSELAAELMATSVNGTVNIAHKLKQIDETTINNLKALNLQTTRNLTYVNEELQDKNFTLSGRNLENTEDFIGNDGGDNLASGFVNRTADEVMVNITTLVDIIIGDVEQNIARCRPLYGIATGLVDTACVNAMYPLNILWFSLGWCIFFLIPYLILSFKLSKLFKKTVPYTKDFDAVNFPEEMLLTERPKQVGYDDLQPIDNLGFDPMEEYRNQIAAKGSPIKDHLQPPYTSGLAIPRPNLTKFDANLKSSNDGISGSPLKQKVPLPHYGEAYSGDSELAHLY